jgi:hypothetical protein
MLTPVSWAELEVAKPATLETPLTNDVFGNEVARIRPQRFGSLQPTSIALLAVNAADGHSHVVSALKQLLADGKAHAAESSAPPASPPNCCRREPSPSTW